MINLQRISLYKTKTLVALRDSGIKYTLWRILEEALLKWFFLYRQFIIYEKQLTDLSYPRLLNPHLKFSFVAQDKHETLQKIEKLSGYPRDLALGKLRSGSECLVASDNGKLVGFNLVSYGNAYVPYLDNYQMLKESEAWSDQIYVSTPYRQSGVATDIRHIIFNHLGQNGYTRLFGGYLPSNTRSGMLAKKLGFVEIEKVTLVKILWWKKYYVNRLFRQP